MRSSTLALGATLMLSLVAVPTASYASGWSSRNTIADGTVVPTQSLTRVAPLGENYRFPTRADRVQGMPPYQAYSNSPYAAETAARPAPAPVPATPDNDPVYFNQAMGTSRY